MRDQGQDLDQDHHAIVTREDHHATVTKDVADLTTVTRDAADPDQEDHTTAPDLEVNES